MTVRLCLGLLALLGAVSAGAQDSSSLTVATYNIRYANPGDGQDIWQNRVDAVVEFIKTNDLVGLQEVTAGQLQELVERLDQYSWYGVGRDDGRSGGEHAAVFYRQDRLEQLSAETFWLSETPQQAGSKGWDAALPRTCTVMQLQDRESGRKFWVANTHFDHKGEQARRKSGELLAQWVQQQSAEFPIIVMGDLNCLPGSAPYQALAAEMKDARQVSQTAPQGPRSTWNGFDEIVEGRIIDHLFVRGPLKVQHLIVRDPKTESGRFASDHLPVQIQVQLHP